MAIDSPAPVACAAPHAPSASPCPAVPVTGIVMAAVSVATANRPLPNPISPAPLKNITFESRGAAKITVEKAAIPTRMPKAPIR